VSVTLGVVSETVWLALLNLQSEVLADSVDWVQECAYRQAMLIDRINCWMYGIKVGFWVYAPGYVIYFIIDTVFRFTKKTKP
jgi:hypothetical protein